MGREGFDNRDLERNTCARFAQKKVNNFYFGKDVLRKKKVGCGGCSRF
jgi:hypothetical protein